MTNLTFELTYQLVCMLNRTPSTAVPETKRKLIGREFDLLLESESEESDLLLEGRTPMHAPEIDGKVFVNDLPEDLIPQPGQFYRCQITETHDYDLVAKIV